MNTDNNYNSNYEDVNIKTVKNYWDSQPCNVKHSSKPLNTIEYYNEVEKRKYFVEPHILDFANFQNWNKKSVLEIGCGIGTDAVNFIRHGANYTGIDLSPNSLQIAKNRLKIFGLNGNLFSSNIELLDDTLLDQEFDLIYSFGVLHHTPNLEVALKNIRRICNQNTQIKIMVYAKNSWKQKMIESGLDQPEAQYGCPIANVYTDEEITNLLGKTGFRVIEIRQDHIFPYEVLEYKNYKYVKVPWFESMPENVFQTLQKSFGWHLLIDAKIQ